MKEFLAEYIKQALNAEFSDIENLELADLAIRIDNTKDKSHGDFACNIAMQLAKPCRMKPRDIAEKIVAAFPEHPLITKVNIAGPGFINFFIDDSAHFSIIEKVLTDQEQFGRCDIGAGIKINLEFVSANPTGPLHVGHGRGAAYGATLANLLEAAGYNVHREYYVNDAGRQMDILAASVWLRYLENLGEAITFPLNAYHGDYVKDIAVELAKKHDKQFLHTATTVFSDLPTDSEETKEAYIDAVINKAKTLLTPDQYKIIFDTALNSILAGIREDLQGFGVEFNQWYSERSLKDNGAIQAGIEALIKAGHTYEKNGALWFKAINFGDDKDRVLVRDNGQTTYFASDVAYHYDKFARGANQCIDILGADHHGYVTRLKAVVAALGNDPDALTINLVQFAILYRGEERVQMSTRSGSFVTLKELCDEVGRDAARYFYVMRKCEQHLDFDLELAKSQSNDNPVYYIQYAHARIASVFRQLADKNWCWEQAIGLEHLAQLKTEHEKDLAVAIGHYPETLKSAAQHHEPHLIAQYLQTLAKRFHAYYNSQQFLVDDENLRNARLSLIAACQHVLKSGLTLLGLSAPEIMQ